MTARIEDTAGEQAVDTLLYVADAMDERYDPQATLLRAGTAALTRGVALVSNRGRVLAEITADTLGAHDTIVGHCCAETNATRFGPGAGRLHSCRDNFLLELARYGRDRRDIVGNVNFFMPVPVRDGGDLAVREGRKEPGHYVEITAGSRDVLIVISNCPQINNPCNGFDPTPVAVWLPRGPNEDRR
jgi:urea carboxylase-associated protein 1